MVDGTMQALASHLLWVGVQEDRVAHAFQSIPKGVSTGIAALCNGPRVADLVAQHDLAAGHAGTCRQTDPTGQKMMDNQGILQHAEMSWPLLPCIMQGCARNASNLRNVAIQVRIGTKCTRPQQQCTTTIQQTVR